MTPKELKNDKEYKFSGKKITWTISGNSLFLEVELDWVKYNNSGITLPPDELGRSTNWHFQLSEDSITSLFVCNWDLRRVKDNLKLIDSINEKIAQFALEETI
jgi:hypothetical protein|uniref:Uncharacterized protein n=1 Tax=viral metagenome TaxID=1070528 RepID=A0A6C0H3P5_9ZZZZ